MADSPELSGLSAAAAKKGVQKQWSGYAMILTF